jgi:hypothetical protein
LMALTRPVVRGLKHPAFDADCLFTSSSALCPRPGPATSSFASGTIASCTVRFPWAPSSTGRISDHGLVQNSALFLRLPSARRQALSARSARAIHALSGFKSGSMDSPLFPQRSVKSRLFTSTNDVTCDLGSGAERRGGSSPLPRTRLKVGEIGRERECRAAAVFGLGGWIDFEVLFAGRNAAGENRIYAVNSNGQCSHTATRTPRPRFRPGWSSDSAASSRRRSIRLTCSLSVTP